MPTVKNPAALKQAYEAARTKILKREIPTQPIRDGQPLFRYTPAAIVPKPAAGGHVSKADANKVLVPYDLGAERGYRFSGPFHDPAVPSAGGLYCVLQQQALINESISTIPARAAIWRWTANACCACA